MTGPGTDEDDLLYFSSPRWHGSREKAQAVTGEYGRAWLELVCSRCPDHISRADAATRGTLRHLLQAPLPWDVLGSRVFRRLTRRLVGDVPPDELWRGVQPILDRKTMSGEFSGADPGSGRNESGAHGFRVYAGQDTAPHPLPGDRTLLNIAPGQIHATVADALTLIDDVAPEYGPWVTDAIHSIVALDGSDGVRYSSGPPEQPGLVFLTFPARDVNVAAMLVHEASHQYFMVLESLLRLHDGSDTEEYFSPIKRRGRRIDMILFAFHAFGNGALFDREALRCGARTPEFVDTLDRNLQILEEHHTHLKSTSALTAAGRALCEPLASLLFDVRPDNRSIARQVKGGRRKRGAGALGLAE